MFRTHPCIKKLDKPVLSYKDSVEGSALTYNAGVAKWKGRYVMLFRNDYGDWRIKQHGMKIDIRVAFSDDGINWDVQPYPVLEQVKNDDCIWAYDPRITVIDDKAYVCFAIDTLHGVRGGIAVTEDFKEFEILHITVPDNRNMVLFPEKIDGKFVRLERPMAENGRYWLKGFDIWMSKSPDLKYWGEGELVLCNEDVPFSELKIGPAAPPVKTEKGWLTLFHAVRNDENGGKLCWNNVVWDKYYCAGIMLLDLKDPSKVIGICDEPILVPDREFETDIGYRVNTVFPGGMVLEDDGEVKIYYGAADTFECLATARVEDLLALCKPVEK